MSARDPSGPTLDQTLDQKRALARKLLAKKLERPRVAQLSFARSPVRG